VPKFERKLAALMGGALPVAGGAAGGAAGAEPEPEPAAVPEGAPAGNAAAMSDRVLNFEARTGTDLTPITGWQDKPLVSLGKSLEGVPVKDVQIHAEVAVEFGESYKLTHPAEKRSVDQLGKPRQAHRALRQADHFSSWPSQCMASFPPFLPCGFAHGPGGRETCCAPPAAHM
jgi:hypothetical protein